MCDELHHSHELAVDGETQGTSDSLPLKTLVPHRWSAMERETKLSISYEKKKKKVLNWT